MIETERETNEDTIKGATMTTEKVTVTPGDYKKFMNSFDSAEEVLIYSVKKAEDFKRDITALIESMNNLYQENFIPLTLLDVAVEVNVHTYGKLAIQAHLGHKNSAEDIMKFMHDSVKEGD